MKALFLLTFLATSLNLFAQMPEDFKKLERLQEAKGNLEYAPSNLEALDELDQALKKLDSRLDRRVAAIEARRKREEEIKQKEIEAILNAERDYCEDVPLFVELDNVCFEDEWMEQSDECFMDMNVSLSE